MVKIWYKRYRHNLRLWFQTYVPGFGLGSNSYPNILIPISIFHV